MLFSYLKTAIRNIRKYKTFSFINLFGLAAAMTISLLIILMLADQKSYDRFNLKKDNIYRILADKPDFRHPYATTPFPLAVAIKTQEPIVIGATCLTQGVGGDAGYGGRSVEMRGYFADPSFFSIFSFELARGDKYRALSAPNSMIITEELAHELFGDEDPIGKTVAFSDRGLNYLGQGEATGASTSWGDFSITGVIGKKYKSHLKFDVLISSSSMQGLIAAKKIPDLSGDWQDIYHCYTYVLLDPSKKSSDLDAALRRMVSVKYAQISDLKGLNLTGQKLTDISPGILLGNEPSIILPKVAYYFLSLLALIVMISACLNYIGLSIARALTRAKEIGIRKVNGALRKNLIFQFMCESVLTALFALVMALLFLYGIRAAFLGLWINQYLNFDLNPGPGVFLVFLGLSLLIGFVAGVYPALYLSRFQPVKVLRNFDGLRPGKLGIRKALSIFQFAFSLIFIITSLLIFNQSRHFLTFKYEFNPNNVVNVELQNNDYRIVAREFSSVPGVSGVSACDYIPVTGRSEGGRIRRAGSKDEYKAVTMLKTDENFINNMQLRLVAGKNLPAGRAGDHCLVMNQAAVKEFGFKDPSAIVGQSFTFSGDDSASYIVVGAVEDFHMGMDRDGIEPLVMQNQPNLFQFVNIRIAAKSPASTLAKLEIKWKTIDPVHVFKYRFFDDQLAASSQGFFDIVSILGFIAFLAVTIACLGMFGMATYTTERKMKEVGIRKVLGAENSGIVLLLSGEFIRILIIAILVAAPSSYFLNNLWLRKFPNRVDFGLGTVSLGALILLIWGLLAIGSQTIRAARRNPVDALKAN
jgi:putative ABC transport system permease protein